MEKYTLQELKWIESALRHFTETHSQEAFKEFKSHPQLLALAQLQHDNIETLTNKTVTMQKQLVKSAANKNKRRRDAPER